MTNRILLFCFLCGLFAAVKAQEVENPMVTNGIKYLGTPYVAHTLEVNDEEELVINTDEVDCTTFVEYVLAESLTPVVDGTVSEGQFADNVIKIRYRNAQIDGYTSRLHYIAEWVENGVRQGFLEDVTAAKSSTVRQVNLNYMSSHPELYKHLANNPENVAKMKAIEEKLNTRTFHYLPKEQLNDNGKTWIKPGDIIALCTNIEGLDVSHLGIAFYAEGKLTILHASYTNKKVEVSGNSLAQMLKNSDKLIGIRVLRMKK